MLLMRRHRGQGRGVPAYATGMSCGSVRAVWIEKMGYSYPTVACYSFRQAYKLRQGDSVLEPRCWIPCPALKDPLALPPPGRMVCARVCGGGAGGGGRVAAAACAL